MMYSLSLTETGGSLSNLYKIHQIFMKKVMLHCQKTYPEIRIFEYAVGQAYAKFSVIDAIKYAISTKDFSGAMRKLIIIVYGTKGHPDLAGLYKGIWIGIEIKTNSGKQSLEQKNFQAMIESAGGTYMVVSNMLPIEDQIAPLNKIKEWANNGYKH